jgi:SAM-dependent methyltransferase
MYSTQLNCFLQTRAEIGYYTDFLRKHDLVEHSLDCKNWDLGKIALSLGDGNLLDMGCCDSFILNNASKLNLKGLKYGIDLLFRPEDVDDHSIGSWNNPNSPRVAGCKFFKGDLMHTPFDSGMFQNLTCLSVIEHGVDFNLFAAECSRLLSTGGKVYLTYDYWDPKVNTYGLKLYGLDWNVLDKSAVLSLIDACSEHGLEVSSTVDWTTQEQVINPGYMSPHSYVSYTFGILMFTKLKYF